MRKFLLNIFNIFAATLGLSFFGAGNGATAATNPPASSTSALVLNCAPQAGMSRKQEVECACQAALSDGSIEALESFLARYGTEDSACSALATTALTTFATPDSDGDGVGTIGGSSGEIGYGR